MPPSTAPMLLLLFVLAFLLPSPLLPVFATGTSAPTSSPTCQYPPILDVIWVLDASSSIVNAKTAFQNITAFTVLNTLNVSDYQTSIDYDLFVDSVNTLSAVGGTTDTSGALDYVRKHMFTEQNRRVGGTRVVVLGTDGHPTDSDGAQTPQTDHAAELAVQHLRDEDDVIFIFLRLGEDYPLNWMESYANYIYQTTYATLQELNSHQNFMCISSSMAPTLSPSSAPTTDVPTVSPTVSPTRQPVVSQAPSLPTSLPTSSPTCQRIENVDIIWVLDSSNSIIEMGSGALTNVTDFIAQYAGTINLSPTQTRMGFVQFAGPHYDDPSYQTIGDNLDVTDSAAVDVNAFDPLIRSLLPMGGTTNTAGALDYVRQHMFTPTNKRAGSHRIVVLITDGNPSDSYGNEIGDGPITAANEAVVNLREEDDSPWSLFK
ncbi:hypothetical protein BASA81_008406 [Batrachochytrium salamandrivorans]|nr:hypothetical protein BASA81_008406 [Batrachochytrium salamandrivorans]